MQNFQFRGIFIQVKCLELWLSVIWKPLPVSSSLELIGIGEQLSAGQEWRLSFAFRN